MGAVIYGMLIALAFIVFLGIVYWLRHGEWIEIYGVQFHRFSIVVGTALGIVLSAWGWNA